jgi:hypothetical protein
VEKCKLILIASLSACVLSGTLLARPAEEPSAATKPTSGAGTATTHSAKPSKKAMLDELQAQGAKIPDQLRTLATADATSCNTWWLSGSHSWKWNGIPGWYINARVDGESHTYYGGQTDPNACGQPPLIVDKISLDVHTNGGFYLHAQNTAFNTNAVSANDNGWQAGSGSNVCGAYGKHYAEKWGVQWNSTSVSGCQ